jgi:hydrogenase expression/formation protein HypD
VKLVSEFRRPDVAARLRDALHREAKHPWVLMEVCGGQTHSIVRHGIDEMLPPGVELVHGPGCPVCVTPVEMLDRSQAVAMRPEVILCTFGDMIRVPGSRGDLLARKSEGADVRVVYSPLDAVALAEKSPDRQVVFFSVGFETTAPATAMAVAAARKRGLSNFSLLVTHVLVPPAITAILESPDNRVQAFLGPGHVCTVMGTREYEPIAERYKVPVVVTGFEPVDLLEGILFAVRQLEAGKHDVEVQYARAVQRDGNAHARAVVSEIFEVCDRKWRGMGTLPMSGYRLRPELAAFDAEQRFQVSSVTAEEASVCIAAQVLKGQKKPHECPAFGKECTPERPLGAPMVSTEGACAAYFAHGRDRGRGLLG